MLPAGKISVVQVRRPARAGERELVLPCKVSNLLVAPEKELASTLRLKLNFTAAE